MTCYIKMLVKISLCINRKGTQLVTVISLDVKV